MRVVGDTHALDALANIIATSARDWGDYYDMNLVYGIVIGWDPDPDPEDPTDELAAMPEIAETFGLSDEVVKRVRRWHAEYRAAQAQRPRLAAALTELVAHGDLTPSGRLVLQRLLNTQVDGVADGVIHRHTEAVGSRMSDGRAGSVVSGDADG